MRRLLLLLAVAALVSVSGCASWFAKPEPVVQVRYKSLPFPYMSVEQTKVFIACRIAFGGNDKRRNRLGDAKVKAAGETCFEKFDVFDPWWPVYVSLSGAYDRLDNR